MGLDIIARSTNGHICGNYSRLHYTARFLALLYCGMPEYLDDKNKVSSMAFYMSSYIGDKNINTNKLRQFHFALQISGHEFPNLLLHSDCDGGYTKRGKLDLDGNLLTGNSTALMRELEKIVNEETFQDEKYKMQMEYTKSFYELVKKEVKEGKGKIEFC